MVSATNVAYLFSVALSLNEAAQSLENYSESLQQDLDKIEDNLRKLYNFNSVVNGLFNDDLNNFKLVMQSVTVLNKTVVGNSDRIAKKHWVMLIKMGLLWIYLLKAHWKKSATM